MHTIILVGKLEGKKLLWGPRLTSEYNIRLDLRQEGCEIGN